MTGAAPPSVMSRLLDWLDPARVSHLRKAHFWTVFDERSRRRPLLRRLFNSGHQHHLGEQFMWLVVLLWINPACACLAVPLGVLLLLATPFSRASARAVDGDRLPYRLIDVLHPTRPRADVVRDLWLAGLGGREAALTLYREYRRHDFRMAVAMYILQLMMTGFALLFTPGRSWVSLLLLLLYGTVSAIFPMVYFYFAMGAAAVHAVQSHVNAWRDGRTTAWRLYSPALVSLAYFMLYMLITMLSVVLIFILEMAGLDWELIKAGQSYDPQNLRLKDQLLQYAWWFFTIVVPLITLCYFMRRRHTARLESALHRADECFQDWVQNQHDRTAAA